MMSGKTIIIQSTVPPFTTRDMVEKIMEDKTGLKAGKDFGLAYSPEMTQSPQVLQDLRNYPKVVGGIDAKSTLIISMVYASFAPSIIDMGNIVAAELEKSVENTYRDVNIAFANVRYSYNKRAAGFKSHQPVCVFGGDGGGPNYT